MISTKCLIKLVSIGVVFLFFLAAVGATFAQQNFGVIKGKVVEEGVGYVDLIIVACPGPEDLLFLAAGPVLSYYEFKHPMNDRLTDEAWRELLASPDRPERPPWFQSLVREAG